MEKKKLSEEQKKMLKEPLPPEAIKPHPTKPYLSTIKAIYVVERLNDVFGIGEWDIDNTIIERTDKWVVVKANFTAKEYTTTVRDVFGGNDNADLGDAYKGACTDALTKIGSYLGIGMDVYKGLADGAKKEADKKNGQNTTAYNHKALGTKEKPLIGNAAFKKVMERIAAGETEIREKVFATYTLDETQTKLLKNAKPPNNGQPA